MRAPLRTLPPRRLLFELFRYNQATGVLTHRPRPPTSRAVKIFNAKHAGKPAGTVSVGRPDGSDQYLYVGVRRGNDYQQYPVHRIIWKMMTGKEPPSVIDHKNSDNLDNRWSNLRAATNGKNLWNAKLRRDNTSGAKGVHWARDRKQWRVVISVDKKQLNLGRFATVKEAKAAADVARRLLHGEFARFS